jgi:hypothetical protein
MGLVGGLDYLSWLVRRRDGGLGGDIAARATERAALVGAYHSSSNWRMKINFAPPIFIFDA